MHSLMLLAGFELGTMQMKVGKVGNIATRPLPHLLKKIIISIRLRRKRDVSTELWEKSGVNLKVKGETVRACRTVYVTAQQTISHHTHALFLSECWVRKCKILPLMDKTR